MDREELAEIEVGHTEIAPAHARLLVVVFCCTLLAVPAIQIGSWAVSGRSADAGTVFPMIRSLRLPGTALRAARESDGPVWARLIAGNRAMLREISSIKDDLREESVVADALRPIVQEMLIRLGWGNERVLLGLDGWLFFRPAVDALTGGGFLEPDVQERRIIATDSWREPPDPDPVAAIVGFAEQLEERGIDLVLFPIPVKAGVLPGRLSSRYRGSGVLHNRSWPEFLSRMERAGVYVELPEPAFGRESFLKTDSHWNWETMDAASERLAGKLREMGVVGSANVEETIETTSNRGDLFRMLPVISPSGFPQETVRISSVSVHGSRSGDDGAEVVLLGDSFSNIYSDESMGWGRDAGLSERLSFYLRAPVVSIIRNNDGAFITRVELARRLDENPAFLDGVRVVVWEFTERELSLGDWRPVELGDQVAAPDSFVELPAGRTLRVKGVIKAMGELPDPEEAPYPDYLIGLHLVDLRSDDLETPGEALVFVWAMRDYDLETGARLRTGDEISIVLRSWSDVPDDIRTVARGEVFDPRVLSQIPCWGEVLSK